MTLAKPTLTLTEFLERPESEPASEYIDGEILQKPMPKTRHSRLQLTLCNAINEVTESAQIAYAFPELRCTFEARSLVPDIAVLLWSNIPWDAEGEPKDDVCVAPDWMIEILSPEQSANRVTQKILYSLKHGTQLGWLVDPSDRSIMVFIPDQLPTFFEGSTSLPTLSSIVINLTCEQIFSWLRMNPSVE